MLHGVGDVVEGFGKRKAAAGEESEQGADPGVVAPGLHAAVAGQDAGDAGQPGLAAPPAGEQHHHGDEGDGPQPEQQRGRPHRETEDGLQRRGLRVRAGGEVEQVAVDEAQEEEQQTGRGEGDQNRIAEHAAQPSGHPLLVPDLRGELLEQERELIAFLRPP